MSVSGLPSQWLLRSALLIMSILSPRRVLSSALLILSRPSQRSASMDRDETAIKCGRLSKLMLMLVLVLCIFRSIYKASLMTLMTAHQGAFDAPLLMEVSTTPESSHTGAGDPLSATIHEKVFTRPRDDNTTTTKTTTPNLYHMLKVEKHLPKSKCLLCLRKDSCEKCRSFCDGYCDALCHVNPAPKFVAKEWIIKKPLKSKENRLIPRIIFQTWLEEVDQDKYPNMSRLQQSFRNSGWEYRFYTTSEAASFLSEHFPPEVREAYDSLIPGSFKADLWRYCVLLIHGGLYADIDILLESDLDLIIAPDVGFMTPFDLPGRKYGGGHCVDCGFMASAPGHPFLAKTIQTIVNQVRNKFTQVDLDATFCPNPGLVTLHQWAVLYTSGPCALGTAMNRVIGREPQAQFEAGEDPIASGSEQSDIPGRTLILTQNKDDLGASRITFDEMNTIVAVTDMPGGNDLEHVKDKKAPPHYSKAHVVGRVYGVDRVYENKVEANEDIRIVIEPAKNTKQGRI